MAQESSTTGLAVAPTRLAVAPGRIDRARFDAAVFPSVMDLQIRFDDLDLLSHVNNVAIIALLQEARVHFNRAMPMPAVGDGLRTVVGGMLVEYGIELTYPGTVQISTGIIAIGRTSYTFGQMIGQGGKGAVYSQITMVVTDASGPAAIPDLFRSSIAEHGLIRD